MKKPLNYIATFTLVLLAPLSFSSAETKKPIVPAIITPAKIIEKKTPVVSSEKKADTAENKENTTSASQKSKIEIDLLSTHDQFLALIVRTQSTIDRLASKSVNTTKAQLALDMASKSLDNAKINLETLAQTEPKTAESLKTPSSTEKMTTKKTELVAETENTQPKDPLKKVQESLKETRSQLVESLNALKLAVEISLSKN